MYVGDDVRNDPVRFACKALALADVEKGISMFNKATCLHAISRSIVPSPVDPGIVDFAALRAVIV